MKKYHRKTINTHRVYLYSNEVLEEFKEHRVPFVCEILAGEKVLGEAASK